MKDTVRIWRAAILAVIVTTATFSCAAKASAPQKSQRRVALVVQNHTSDAPTLPMAAFADTLVSRLSGKGKMFRVVNPYNVIGVNQNRTATGEAMPAVSAQEIGRMLGAEGVVTATIQEFTGEDIGAPSVAHKLKVRLAINLMDAATGETVCGVDGVEQSKNLTTEKVKADTATLYEGLMHAAAAKAAKRLLKKAAAMDWQPASVKKLKVFFGCNVLGAVVKIDGQSYGTCPAEISVTPGSHGLLVSYPPYYYEFESRAEFNQEGQTYKVVLQLTPEGEAQRNRAIEYETKLVELKKAQLELEKTKTDNSVEYEKKKLSLEREKKSIEVDRKERCALFKKQLEFVDAMLDRYELSGEADDYVRKTIAEGTAVYWKNSYGRIAITDGSADKIEFATPSTDAGDLAVPPSPREIGEGLQKFLMTRKGH